MMEAPKEGSVRRAVLSDDRKSMLKSSSNDLGEDMVGVVEMSRSLLTGQA